MLSGGGLGYTVGGGDANLGKRFVAFAALTIDAFQKLLQRPHFVLNARLCCSIVVLGNGVEGRQRRVDESGQVGGQCSRGQSSSTNTNIKHKED